MDAPAEVNIFQQLFNLIQFSYSTVTLYCLQFLISLHSIAEESNFSFY